MSELSSHYRGRGLKKSHGGGWLLFLVFALGLLVLLRLSWWQYQRGNQKLERQAVFADPSLDKPISEVEAMARGWPEWQLVFVQGEKLATPPLILDNRTRGGAAGYETLVVWLSGQGTHFLVNQGWLPFRNGERSVRPPDEISNHVLARIHKPSDYELTALPKRQGNQPWWLPGLHLKKVQGVLVPHGQWAPVVLLQVLPESDQGRQRDWKQALGGMPASRHFGYAVQWGLLAVAWSLLFGNLWFKTLRRITSQ